VKVRLHSALSRRRVSQTNSVIDMLGATVAAACILAADPGMAFAQQATGQSAQSGDTIVLPTVQVETTAEPAASKKAEQSAAQKREAAARRERARREAAAAREAARQKAAAQAEAESQAKAQADAEAKAKAQDAAKEQARANPYADPNAPFKSDRLGNSRLPTDIADTPRTITAIGKEVLEATGTTSIREIARTTPGVSLGFGEGGNSYGDNLYIRGFKANNDIYLDGIRDSGVGLHETYNTEQVEIVKGPAGTVGGRGTTGGAIDIVTKQARDVTFYEATSTLTSAGTKRVTADLNQAFTDEFQLRFNGLTQIGNVAGRDNVYDDRYGAALAATIKPSDVFTLQADYSYTKFHQMPDWGVPYTSQFGAPVTELGVSRSTFYGVVGRDFQDTEQHIGTVKGIYDIDDNTKLTNTARYSHSTNDYILTAPSSVIENGSSNPANWQTSLSFKSRYQVTDMFSDALELSGDETLGGLKHTYVIGGSYTHEHIDTYSYANLTSENYNPPAGQNGCVVSVINPNPIAAGCWTGGAALRSTTPTKTDVQTTSIYALDTVELTEQWLVNGGVRVDFYDVQRTQTNGIKLGRRDTLFNWNAGVTYKPIEPLSIYAAIATSMNPSGQEVAEGGGYYGGLDANGALLGPERNTSLEAGVKYEYNSDLLLTAAVFETTKHNGREDVGNASYGSLKYRMRGVEFGVQGNLTDRISLFGSAVFMESKILESRTASNVGKGVPNIAHQQVSLLATYKVNDELTVGGRINYGGKKDLGSYVPNGNTLPGYTTFDLMATYDFSKHLQLQMNLNNVTNKTYYDTAYRSGEPFTYVAPGREFMVTLKAKF
jgi:catecholate siderophore receptor